MTHEELIETVAKDIKHYYGNEFDIICAKRCISTILTALQEPTEEMLEAGSNTYCGSKIYQRLNWKAILNASPLAGENNENN